MIKNYLFSKRIRLLPFLSCLLWLMFCGNINAQNVTLTWDKEAGCQINKPKDKRGYDPEIDASTCVRVCETSKVTYTLNNSSASWPATWTVTGGTITGSNNTSCTVNWGNAGWGFVSVTVNTPNGPKTKELCLEIIDGPKAEFMIYPGTASSYVACLKEILYFTNLSQPDGGSQIISYVWDFGDDSFSSEFEPEHFYSKPGTYTVVLTVTNECNCSKTFKKEIIVNPFESYPISCNSVVCENGSDTYTIPKELAEKCDGFNWSVSGGTITSQQPYGPSIDVTWDHVDDSGFGYVYFDAKACGLDCGDVSIKVPVVKANGTIKGDAVICAGEQNRYKLPQWPTTDFVWSVVANGTGAILLDTDQRNEIIVQASAQGQIILRCTYQNTMLKCGGTAEFVINVRAVGVITGPKEVCQNSSATYTVNNSYLASWTLKRPNNTTATGSGNSFTNLFTVPGNYTLTITGTNFCPPSQPFIIRVDAIPATPDGNTIVGPAKVCAASPVEYSMVNTVPGTVLKWIPINGTVSGSAYGEKVTVEFTPGFANYGIQVVRENAAEPHCTSPAATKIVTLHVVSLTMTGPQNNVCASSSANYSVAYTEGEVYEWSVYPANAGSVSSFSQNTATVLWNHLVVPGTEVRLRVRKCNIWYPVALPVNVILGPTLTVNVPASICPDVPFSATLTSNPPLSGGNVTWNYGDGTVLTLPSNVNPPPYQYNNVASSTTYTVTVTVPNPNGCLMPAVQSANITVNPAPVALITEDYNRIFCNVVTPFTLTATVQSGPAGTNTVEWWKDGVFTGSTGVTFPVNAFGEYKAWVKNANGCGQFTNIVKVINNCGNASCTISPAPTVTMSAPQGSCNTINAVASATPAPLSYSWSAGPQATVVSSGLTGAQFSYTKAGNYTVIYNATYMATNGQLCTISRIANQIIPFIPKIKYSVSCGSTPGTYTITMQDHSNYYPSTPPTSKIFVVNGTQYSVLPSTNTYSVQVPANAAYTLELRLGRAGFQNCQDVTSVTLPALPSAAIAPPSPICDGTGIQLSPAGGVIPGYSYIWNFGDGSTNLQPQPIKVWGSSGIKTVTLTVRNQVGCPVSSSVNVTVNPNTLNGNIISDSPNCEGDPITLTYNNTGTAPSQYVWMQDQTVIATTTTPSVQVTSSGSYWVSVTNNLGCIRNLSTVPAKFIMTPDPVVTGPTGVCVDESFTLSGYAGTGPIEYRWLRNNVQVAGWSSSPKLVHTVSATGSYTFKVELRINDGSGSYCVSSATYPVTVYAKPNSLSLSFSLVSCEPYKMKLVATGDSAGTYVWSNGMSGSSIIVNSGGPYKVTFTNAGGCSITRQIDVPQDPEVYFWIFPKGCYDFCWKRGEKDGPFDILGPSPFAIFNKWFWVKDGNVVQSGVNSAVPNYEVQSTGTYAMTLNNGYCEKTTESMDVKVTDCKCDVRYRVVDVYQTQRPFCQYIFTIYVDNPYGDPIVVNLNALVQGDGIFQPGAVTVPPGGGTYTLSFVPLNFNGGLLEIVATSTPKEGELCRTIMEVELPSCGASDSDMRTIATDESSSSVKDLAVTSLVVSPNPSDDVTNLTYTYGDANAQSRVIEIYSLMGILLESHSPDSISGKWTVDMHKYAAGHYIVVMRQDGVPVAQKAIIVK